MSHQITLVRSRNRDYQLLNNGCLIGRVSKPLHRRCFHVHIDGVYFRENERPNRRGGSTATTVTFLKDVPASVEAILDVIAESDAKELAEMNALLSDVVQVDVKYAAGSVLNYFVAIGAGKALKIDNYCKYVVKIDNMSFDPINDSSFILKLMNEHITYFSKYDGNQFVAHVDGGIFASGESIELAVLRAFSVSKCGSDAFVPRCLLNL